MDGSLVLRSTLCRHLHQSNGQRALCDAVLPRPAGYGSPRRRVWYISPEGFRELRRSCLLSRKTCAELLGCSLSTVRAWDRGRNRVPWSAVRLLRLFRCGDLGALRTEWRGWTINHNGIVSPSGIAYSRGDLSWWSLTCRQAEAFRQARQQARTRPSGGADAEPAGTLTDGGGFGYKAARDRPTAKREALSPLPVPADRFCSGSGSGARRGVTGNEGAGVARKLAAGAQHPDASAGLVSSQKQVTREGHKARKNAASSRSVQV